MGKTRCLVALLSVVSLVGYGVPARGGVTATAEPPLAASSNVELVRSIPGTAAGMNFRGHYAFVTGWDGLTVLDIKQPANPQLVGGLPLAHFENEDVDVCGNTLLISEDRATRDLGAILYVVDISTPAGPELLAALPLGLTGEGRGSGHIANFVTRDCSRAWIDGGDHVEVVDLSKRSEPKSLGKFKSVASRSEAFEVTHDTELDSQGIVWNVGGGGAAGYRITDNPLKPKLVGSTGKAGVNPSPLNDFILHNSQRRGQALLVTEEDYVDTDETPPGSCRGQGKFETWSLSQLDKGRIKPLDTWQTELNGALFGGDAEDSKAPATVNCSSHWFDTQAGVAAVGWYEQGVRFLDVSNPGRIRQVGYYIPANGATWAAYWSPTDPRHQIVYTADVTRGIDVLRIRAGGRGGQATVKAPIPQAWWGVPDGPGARAYRPSPAFGWSCPLLTR